MAHLTKSKIYDIKDSNIALLGSDLERRVREEAGDTENAWGFAGLEPGLEIWRVEKFHIIQWPKDRFGSFYDGDSYIILHTFKKTPESDILSYDLHFWLGENTTQDEAGTAAYKTVELDDHLKGKPVQYREVQGFESTQFLSYFPQFVCLKGGVATGFHHVSEPPPLELHKLYRVYFSRGLELANLVVREVTPEASSLVAGDAYILDRGTKIWQFNSKASSGKEKFRAAEFVQSLVNDRQSQCDVTVYDEGSPGAGVFLSEFGEGVTLRESEQFKGLTDAPPTLLRLSDSTGTVTFDTIEPPSRSSLRSSDVFLLDNSTNTTHPAIYVWLGKDASLNERRLAIQYAQGYLYDKQGVGRDGKVHVAVAIIKMNEGAESEDFLQAIGA